MSNEKQILNVRRDPYKNQFGPNGEELSIQTKDGWDYLFRKLRPSEPFEFVHKRREDGSKSDHEVVPVNVSEWIEDHPEVEVIGYKTMVNYNE